MRETRFLNYSCPFCKRPFKFAPARYYCAKCNREFSIREGIPIFTDSSNCWDFRSSKGKELVNKAQELGWSKALEDIYGNNEYGFWISDISRGCGVLLTSINQESRVLDAGCGWGALSLFAASLAKEVHALDITFDAVKFLDIRAKEDGIENIFPAVGNLFRLPFSNEYFDLVILNGVLEWIPYFEKTNLLPYHLQLMALKETERVLRVGGQILLGIENRYALKYFLGAKDEHTGLRFVTILPRQLANVISKVFRKGSYRNYTYSLSGLKRLFAKAKLELTKIYLPLKSYREISYIIDLNNLKAQSFGIDFVVKYMNREGLKRHIYYLLFLLVKTARLYKLRVLKQLSFSFLLVFKKNNPTSLNQ